MLRIKGGRSHCLFSSSPFLEWKELQGHRGFRVRSSPLGKPSGSHRGAVGGVSVGHMRGGAAERLSEHAGCPSLLGWEAWSMSSTSEQSPESLRPYRQLFFYTVRKASESLLHSPESILAPNARGWC